MTTDDTEVQSTIEALVNLSTRGIFDMLGQQGQKPDPVLVEQYLVAYYEQLRMIPRAVWLEGAAVRLPAELHDALPDELRAPVAQALAAEILRHVHQILSPILMLLGTQTWNLTVERAARIAAESKAAGARRH